MTITEAIRKVLAQRAKPLTAAEIYSAIVAGNLFEFKSKSAASIVRSQLRRHCEGLNSSNAATKKLFRLVGGDRYELLD
jgi:restriction system protein